MNSLRTPTPSRSTNLWFEDGNVVLVAGERTTLTSFRVHRDVLSRRSPVFRNTFLLPAPSDASALIEGCPEFYLRVSSYHASALLEVLYGNLWCNLPQQVVAVLKPAYDYDIQYLIDKGCDILLKRYSIELDQFDEQWPSGTDTRNNLGLDYIGVCHWDPLCVPVIKLAREIPQLERVLRSALYLCCNSDPNNLAQGFHYPDGTTAKLSDDDIRMCIHGTAHLTMANNGFLKFFVGIANNRSPDCRNNGCISGLAQLNEELLDVGKFCSARALSDPRPWMKKMVEGSGKSPITLCSKCFEHVQTRISEHRKKIWDELDDIFGL